MKRLILISYFVIIFLISEACILSPKETKASQNRIHRQVSNILKIQLFPEMIEISKGANCRITAKITNGYPFQIAIFPDIIFRYINFVKLPLPGEQFGSVGQVLGDDVQSKNWANFVLVDSGKTYEYSIDLGRPVDNFLKNPGEFKISIDYCYHGPSRISGIRAPKGCVSSNDITVHVQESP